MNRIKNIYKFFVFFNLTLLILTTSNKVNAEANVIGITFFDQAVEAGLELVTNSQGAAFFDYNFDGHEDLYLAGGGFIAGDNYFYRSRGDATFEQATTEANISGNGPSTNVLAADFNNDGILDVYITSHDYLGTPNYLYFGQANGTFIDVTAASGTGSIYENHNAVAFDYNSDGWLDLYVVSANHMGIEPNLLYHNNGDGTFTDVAAALGVDIPNEFGQGASAGDFDNDGDPDLYVTNEYTGNYLFRNEGGTFTNITDAVTAGTSITKSAIFADYDNDGYLDLYLVNRAGIDELLHNEGNGTFSDASISAGINDNQQGRTFSWADVDNDGWLDIVVTNAENYNDKLWHNQANGTFSDETIAAGISDFFYTDGLGIGDVNGDGFPDLYFSNLDVMDKLYINSGNANHWLTVNPSGRTTTNRAGVGVRVTVVTGSDRQIREVWGGGGYQCFSSLPVEFGLGSNTAADSVILRWTDGHEEVYTSISADQRYIAVEDSAFYAFSMPAFSIVMTPAGTTVPPEGGNIDFTVNLDNLSGAFQNADVWTELRMPDNSSFGPVISRNLNLPAGASIERDLFLGVAGGSPAGDYTYYTFVGNLQTQSVWSFGSFDFSKSGTLAAGTPRFTSSCWDGECSECVKPIEDNADRPTEAAVASISPNPFNPMASVEYVLPTSGYVDLALYNVRGQKVLDLVSEYRQAGSYRLILDGSPLPSGMYFLHFNTESTSQVVKAMLVK
ncbi:MAG: FG-GAP-like repeat-containing protein [bacterium]